MAKLLEGKAVAAGLKEALARRIKAMGRPPHLASVTVGDNASAGVYIRSQQKTAEALGVAYTLHALGADTTQEKLRGFIETLNSDKGVDGIIVQMPLPAQIDYRTVSGFIAPEKDAEAMNPANIGRLVFGTAAALPCTAAAVMELLKETGADLYGKEAVIVGHSEIVGKPLALLLLEKFATVTVCHIGTFKAGKLEEHVRRAEVLVVAVGKAGLIKGEWVKEGAIVIDVGINKAGDTIVGDVEFEAAEKRAAWITPVPGGVGPLTVVMLLRNLIENANLKMPTS